MYFQLSGSDNYLPEREMLYSPPYQYGFADSSYSLAGCGGGEVYRQIGQAQDGDQGQQALLIHKLLTVVICCVVTENRLHKFHLEGKEGNNLFQYKKTGRQCQKVLRIKQHRKTQKQCELSL